MEKQLMMIEKRLGEIICEVKQAGISKEDFLEMAETLFDTNTEGRK